MTEPIYCSCGCDEYDYNPEDFFTCDICAKEKIHDSHAMCLGNEKICCEKCYKNAQNNKYS